MYWIHGLAEFGALHTINFFFLLSCELVLIFFFAIFFSCLGLPNLVNCHKNSLYFSPCSPTVRFLLCSCSFSSYQDNRMRQKQPTVLPCPYLAALRECGYLSCCFIPLLSHCSLIHSKRLIECIIRRCTLSCTVLSTSSDHTKAPRYQIKIPSFIFDAFLPTLHHYTTRSSSSHWLYESVLLL